MPEFNLHTADVVEIEIGKNQPILSTLSNLSKSWIVSRTGFPLLQPGYNARVAKSEKKQIRVEMCWSFDGAKLSRPVATTSLVWFPLAEKADGALVFLVQPSNKLEVPSTLMFVNK